MSRTRDYILAIIVCTALVALAAPTLAAGKIIISESAEVAGDKVLLGEVAQFNGIPAEEAADLSARSLGPAPKPDTEIKLARSQVETRLYNAGIELSKYDLQIPDRVAFKRKATHVSGEDISKFAADYLESNIVWGGGPVRVKIKRNPGDIVLPFGEVSFEGQLDSRPDQYGAKNFIVNVFLNGEKVRTQSMLSYLEVYGNVLVASRPVSAGTTLVEDDVALKEVRLDQLRPGALARTEEVVGKKTRRGLKTEEPLYREMLDIKPDVNNNDLVRLIITGDGFELSARGKALEKGFVGDLIRVIVVGSKKVLEGVIVDKETVEIVTP